MAHNFRPGVSLEGDLSEELEFKDFYTIEKHLRSGSYGTVYVTRHKESGEEFAVKVIDRRYVSQFSSPNPLPMGSASTPVYSILFTHAIPLLCVEAN